MANFRFVMLLVLSGTTGALARTPTAAQAPSGGCIGGVAISGRYSLLIHGLLSTGGAEALAGTMTSDGKCTISLQLFGNIDGVSVFGMAATATYAVGNGKAGVLILTVPGFPQQSYAINRVLRHNEIVGLEQDAVGETEILAKAQHIGSFSQSSLKGTYSLICTGPNELPYALDQWHFDGIGNATYTTLTYEGATLAPASGVAAYIVNPDGSFTISADDSSGNAYVFGGGIDSGGGDVPLATVSFNGSGQVTGASHCIGQPQ